MTKPKTKYPIESFGPALMQALIRGGREKLTLKFLGEDGKRDAHTFQRRIHTLRQRMREVEHEDYIIVTRARVSIFWGDRAIPFGAPADWKDDHNGHKGAFIVIRPQDTEFIDVLANAGIGEATKLPDPKPIDVVASPTALDDLLADLDES